MHRPLPQFGELESAVLEVLWASPSPLSVREVLASVKRKPALAYTTVLTVLDRLFDKNLVLRERDGKAFRYQPAMSKEAWYGEQAARVLVQGSVANEGLLLAFIDSAERASPKLLEQLSKLISRRRGESRSK